MESRARAAESLLLTSSGKDALQYAIRAAELYMQAAGDRSVTKAEALRLRRKCKELIAHAERLKAQLKGPSALPPPLSSSSPSSSPSAPLLPIHHRSETELDILREASSLHGSNYPIWDSEPSAVEFDIGPDAQPFVDDTSFTLSSTQRAHFAAWSRPKELFDVGLHGHDDDFMSLGKTCDLVQDVTTDCSVVASLSAAATVLSGRHLLLSKIIYPFDHAKRQPRLSPSGKYVLRMNFNGCYRRVVIDDRLPASHTNRGLFVVDKRNPHLLWPALLEKAYLKVRGGYDFPGSNSGTDLWVLTGWIPEQIFLQSREDIDIDETWSRVHAAYDVEDVVVTLGTGRVTKQEEESMGLAGHHDYAVQGICLREGSLKLLIKNPWSHEHEEHQTAASSAGSGPFWMAIEEVAQHFESMYLNWNPALFSYKKERHFSWSIPSKVFQASLARNPQFSLSSPAGGAIWILLSRHFKDDELEIARNRCQEAPAANHQLGFMNISIYGNGGKRVQINDGQIYCGPYVDSPQTLARFQASPKTAYTIVVDHQELPLAEYTFTLSIFSHCPVELKDAEEPMSHSLELSSSWTRRTAGGNSSCSTYFLNPQFRVHVPHKSPVSVLISSDDSDIHVHIDMVWGRGERASTVRAKDLVASSGEYRRGCAVADIGELDAGTYTLVCSTFDEGQTAAFILRVASETPIRLEPVPTAAAGRLRTALAPLVPQGGRQQWRALLGVPSLTRMRASARSVVPRSDLGHPISRSRSALMIRILVSRGWGPDAVLLAQSGDGEFQDSASMNSTPEFDVEPGWADHDGIWLILESTGTEHSTTTIEGEIFSDSPVQVGVWETQ